MEENRNGLPAARWIGSVTVVMSVPELENLKDQVRNSHG